jgi:hypothetical protein
LWLQFDNLEDYEAKESRLLELIREYDGADPVVVFLSSTKQIKRLPNSRNVGIQENLLGILYEFIGKNNVKVVEKSIEGIAK